MSTVGWIGLGQMGVPMTTNLLRAGYVVNVFNRSPEKVTPLVELGATKHDSPKSVVEQSDVTFLMLTNASAVREVLTHEDGVLAGMRQGRIIIDMSTISPAESAVFGQMVAEKGGKYLDAPVSGSIGAAAAAGLIILAGANETELAAIMPFFNVLGKKVIPFGSAGKGSAAKLVINMLLGITGQAIGETMLFSEKLGLDQDSILELISNSAMNTGLFQFKKEMFQTQDFPSQFMLELMAKDLGLIKSEIDAAKLDLPLAAVAHATFAVARDHGKGKMDMAAVYLDLKERNAKTA